MNWLEACILSAISRNLCIEMNCTTCGALEFRNELIMLAAKNRVFEDLDYTIVYALAEIKDIHEDYLFRQAIRLVIFDIWVRRGNVVCKDMLWPRLGTGLSYKVLREMQAHSAVLQFDYENKINAIEENRQDKIQHKEERHKQRSERKKQIDRIWHGNRLKEK